MLAQVALAVAIISTVFAALAFFLTLGTAVRLARIESKSTRSAGLPNGSRIPIDQLQPFLDEMQKLRLEAGPSLLTFIAAGCAGCRESIAWINEADPEARGFQLLVIEALGRKETSLRDRVHTACIWIEDRDQSIHSAFNIQLLPLFMLVQDGSVRSTVVSHDADKLLAGKRSTAHVVAT